MGSCVGVWDLQYVVTNSGGAGTHSIVGYRTSDVIVSQRKGSLVLGCIHAVVAEKNEFPVVPLARTSEHTSIKTTTPLQTVC